jgi:GNAT superfamily N-acetyltransferase
MQPVQPPESARSLRLRAPWPDEEPDLTALCIRSKRLWPYDEAFMARAAPALRVPVERLGPERIRVAECAGERAGVVGIEPGDAPGVFELTLLFIEPRFARQGIGAVLLDWACAAARECGAAVIEILADPYARGFYEAQGARFVAWRSSDAIPGRVLPLLRLPLTASG